MKVFSQTIYIYFIFHQNGAEQNFSIIAISNTSKNKVYMLYVFLTYSFVYNLSTYTVGELYYITISYKFTSFQI